MRKMMLLPVIFFIFMFSYASAQNFKNITSDELKKSLDNKTKLALVDARTEREYEQGHIPKAVNVPPEKLGRIETLLPKNKNILLVFYCRGAG